MIRGSPQHKNCIKKWQHIKKKKVAALVRLRSATLRHHCNHFICKNLFNCPHHDSRMIPTYK